MTRETATSYTVNIMLVQTTTSNNSKITTVACYTNCSNHIPCLIITTVQPNLPGPFPSSSTFPFTNPLPPPPYSPSSLHQSSLPPLITFFLIQPLIQSHLLSHPYLLSLSSFLPSSSPPFPPLLLPPRPTTLLQTVGPVLSFLSFLSFFSFHFPCIRRRYEPTSGA